MNYYRRFIGWIKRILRRILRILCGVRRPTRYPRQNYVNQFLQLKCSADVLEIVNPLGNKATKEITESMAVIRPIKRIILAARKKYAEKRKIGVADLGAGNALTSVLVAHLFPEAYVIAIDKRPRQREWGRVRRFKYACLDINRKIFDESLKKTRKIRIISTDTPYIICSIHCCGNLAKRVIEIYQEDPLAKHLIMMPCCNAKFEMNNTDRGLSKIIDGYQMHVYKLAKSCDGYFYFDKNCLSPKNGIIVASK